jgi:hypothetical protein
MTKVQQQIDDVKDIMVENIGKSFRSQNITVRENKNRFIRQSVRKRGKI